MKPPGKKVLESVSEALKHQDNLNNRFGDNVNNRFSILSELESQASCGSSQLQGAWAGRSTVYF